MIKKKNVKNWFFIFILTHLIIWTLVPSISNINLPLDTIEALAWGSNIDWGYSKHPPLSAFLVEFFYQIFGSQDWAYYLLSQICVIISFIYIWKLSNKFFIDKIYSLIAVLFLEGIFFYNFTTPEFNVNVCQLPFWVLTAYYSFNCLQDNKTINWVLLGVFAGLGFLSKYLFIYLILAIAFFFIYDSAKKRKFNLRIFIPILIFLIIISPHLIWLFQNNFITINYGMNRSGLGEIHLIDNFLNPLKFLYKQILLLLPVFLMFYILISKFNFKIKVKNQKELLLIVINFFPLILILLTSILTGAKIRTMWMTPFYIFLGVFFSYFFKKNINLENFRKFVFIFMFLFILSPASYLYISLSKDNKRTDFPGKEIAYLVQNKWNRNFSNEIKIVIGDEWSGGNLSYHLKSRPKWYNTLDNNLKNINPESGFIYVGNPEILKKVCPGVYGTLKPIGICMIGKK